MSKTLMVLWLDGGNVNPFLRIARELADRGHDVDVLGPAQLRGAFEEQGAAFTSSVDWMPTAKELLDAADAFGPDLVIVDFMANETLAGAEATGVTTAVLVHTLLEANRVGDDLAPMWMLGPAAETNTTRSTLGLPLASSHRELLDFAETLLVAAPELLEPDGRRDPRAVYAGPLYIDAGPDGRAATPGGDGPLIVGCAGTAGTDPPREAAMIQRTIEAIALLGARGVITVPDYLDRRAISAGPGVTVTDYVSHPSLLPSADAFVTHAGLGSVCAALVAGCPMVCLPLGREQPTNAAAVRRTGTGLSLAPDSSARDIAAAIEQAMTLSMPEVRVDPTPAIDALESLFPT